MSKTPWASVAISLLLASSASPASPSQFTFTSKTISPDDISSPYLNMATQWQGREDSQPEGLKGAPANLPETDYAHLGGDMKRAYTLLILEWQDYMRYLKDNYPYLFSLAIRTNPFEPNASPVVKQ